MIVIKIIFLIIGSLLAAVILLIVWAIVHVYFIQPYKKKHSYLVTFSGKREPGDPIQVIYYEKDKELHFFSNGRDETLHVPDEEFWDKTMPDSFRGKQKEIQTRLQRHLRQLAAIKLITKHDGKHPILYVDNSKTGPERAVMIGESA